MCAALIAVISCGNRTSAENTAPPLQHPGVFAYTTDDALTVHDGKQVLTRVPGRFTANTEVRFTADRDFVFWKEGEPSRSEVVIAAKVGKPGEAAAAVRIRCEDCGSVVPTTGNQVAWMDPDSTTIMRVDLAAAEPRSVSWRTLPKAPAPQDGGITRETIRLLDARGDRLLVSRTVARFADRSVRSELVTIDTDGALRSYGQLPEVNGFPHGGALSPDGTRAVVFADPTGGLKHNPCGRTAASFLDLGSGAYRTTLPIPTGCVVPANIRWYSGEPTVTLGSWESGQGQSPTRHQLWHYRDQKWSRVSDTGLADRARTNTGATVELSSPTQLTPFELHLVENGNRTRIADRVLRLAVG